MAEAVKSASPRSAARRGRPDTGQSASSILDVAERLAQTRGYNGFSYADIAAELGVTKASLHYHFATKAELGSALIDRYGAVFAQSLATIDQAHTGPCDRLRAYVALYETVIRGERMCLCGMLAAEVSHLAAGDAEAAERLLRCERDLARAGTGGRTPAGELRFAGPANERARAMIGALEGAMLVARVYGDGRHRFRTAVDQVIRDVCKAGVPRQPTTV